MANEEEIKEINCSPPGVLPIYANVSSAAAGKDTMLLCFGFAGPSYAYPYDVVDMQISSIILTWDSVKALQKNIADALKDHKNDLENFKK